MSLFLTINPVDFMIIQLKELITKYTNLNYRISNFYKLSRPRTDLQVEKSKSRFNKNVSKYRNQFKIGDLVYVRVLNNG